MTMKGQKNKQVFFFLSPTSLQLKDRCTHTCVCVKSRHNRDSGVKAEPPNTQLNSVCMYQELGNKKRTWQIVIYVHLLVVFISLLAFDLFKIRRSVPKIASVQFSRR